jgi:hypothetical protein
MDRKKFWIILIASLIAVAIGVGVFMKMSLMELSPSLG